MYAGSQLQLKELGSPTTITSLTFTGGAGGTWKDFRNVIVEATDDMLREGFHNSLIEFDITTGPGDSAPIAQTDTFTVAADREVFFVGLTHEPAEIQLEQTQNNNLYTGNTLSFSFDVSGITPTDVVLSVSATGDLDLASEFLTLSAEGIALGNLFDTILSGGTATSTSAQAEVSLTQAQFTTLAAGDNLITFTVTPSPQVGNFPPNELTLKLNQAVSPVNVSINGDPLVRAGVDGKGGDFTVLSNKVLFVNTNGLAIKRAGQISVDYNYVNPGFTSAVTTPVLVRINDNDAPTVLVRETGGSTDVIESGVNATIETSLDYSPNILRTPGTTTGTIGLGEHDRFPVLLLGGQPYTFEQKGSPTSNGTLTDPRLWLYDSADPNTIIANNDDGGVGLNSRLAFTPPHTGVYILEAAGYADARAGTYTLTTAGGPLSASGQFSGSLGVSGERDRYPVVLVAGQDYTFEQRGVPTGDGTLSDPLLRLYNNGNTLVALNDDFGGTLNSRFTYTPPTSGTYFLEAAAYADTGTGTYTLSWTATSIFDATELQRLTLEGAGGYFKLALGNATTAPIGYDPEHPAQVLVDIETQLNLLSSLPAGVTVKTLDLTATDEQLSVGIGFVNATSNVAQLSVSDFFPLLQPPQSLGSDDVVIDGYSLVLTAEPAELLTVTVSPEITKTTRTGGIRHDQVQVVIDSNDSRVTKNADGTLTVVMYDPNAAANSCCGCGTNRLRSRSGPSMTPTSTAATRKSSPPVLIR